MSARRTQGRSGLVTALLLVLPLASGVGLAVWGLSISPLASAVTAEPVIASVESATRTDAARATATYVEADEFTVSSQSSGTVTSLSITTGDEIANATEAMKVDGVPVIAYVADAPLYRDISRTLEGDDVATAQQLLVDLGYLRDADGKAGYATERAIKAFNKDHGHGDDNTTLAASSLLWVPEGSGAPTQVSVRVGTMLASGDDMYTTTAGSASFTLSVDASDANRVVTADTVTADLAAGTTRLTDEASVEALAKLLGDGTTVSVSVALAEPRTVGTIPATAVLSDASGTMCFLTGLDGEAVEIDTQDGSLGLVDVDAGLIGSPVLVNPREVEVAPSCGS